MAPHTRLAEPHEVGEVTSHKLQGELCTEGLVALAKLRAEDCREA